MPNPVREYLAGTNDGYLYPAIGDPVPPGGAKVLLLTQGGVCIIGAWTRDPFILGWAPLPRRNREKERLLRERLRCGDEV